MQRVSTVLSLMLLLSGQGAVADEVGAFSHTLTGGIFPYVAQAGDKLSRLGSRFGVSSFILARDNHLDRNAPLQAGDEVWIYNLHIVPEWRADGIVINLPQRMLFFFQQGELVTAFPVGLGKPDWPTPSGDFKVVDVQTDKAWLVPPSIQDEMRAEGKAVISRVPPGPKNPLGRHWIGLSASGYGIHGTIAPASVYGFLSHGCIRALPDDIEALSKRAQVGTEVVSSYRTTLLAETRDGRVFVEVHPDIYKRGIDPLEEIQSLAQSNRLTGRIDWRRAFDVAQRQEGLATEVTLTR